MEKVFELKMSIYAYILIYAGIEFRNNGKDIMIQKDRNLLLRILNLGGHTSKFTDFCKHIIIISKAHSPFDINDKFFQHNQRQLVV